MKFILPTGFEIPAGVEPGQEFDAVVTLSLGDDGSVIATALDGSPLASEEEEDEVESVESDPDFLAAVASELA